VVRPQPPVARRPVVRATPAELRRREAELMLVTLRHRYWSAESLLDESRTGTPWWEHPLADPHAVLGVLPGCTVEEAASARRRIAARCHPDVTGDPLAQRRMTAANAAFARIRDANLVLS
jgi:hypothetical protein